MRRIGVILALPFICPEIFIHIGFHPFLIYTGECEMPTVMEVKCVMI